MRKYIKQHKSFVIVMMVSILMALMACAVCADDTYTPASLDTGVSTALTNGMADLASQVSTVIGIIVPTAISIMAVVVMCKFAIKMIKQFVK